MPIAGKKLERILAETEIVAVQDLERARRRMTERGGSLAANLASLEAFDDVGFAAGLAAALELPVADASRLERVAAPRTPSRRAALRALAIERVLLPIGVSREPRAVEIAMFDPTDGEGIERLRALLGGIEVRVSVAPRRALLEAIARAYGREQAGVLGDATVIDDLPDVSTERRTPPATPTPTERHPAPATPPVQLDGELARDIGLLADPDAPTPPPVLLPAGEDPRLSRAMLEVIGVLADLLEERFARGLTTGRSLARYSRLVARQLGCGPASLDEIAVAARLHAVGRALAEAAREPGGAPAPDLAAALGWAASSPEGIGPILRGLTRQATGFGGGPRADVPLGATVIAAVSDYLTLAMATPDGLPDRATVAQLLRVTTPPEIIEALGRVLDAERPKEHADAD